VPIGLKIQLERVLEFMPPRRLRNILALVLSASNMVFYARKPN
jgi:hypothetical protein